MGFFPLIWVSMTLMASAQHAEVPAPLPAPVPGLINTVPLSQSLGSFDLLQCLAAQPPAFPFLSACLPSREPPSLCSSREFTPLPLFAALSPGQHESCVFPHTRCHFGHSKQCHQMSCLLAGGNIHSPTPLAPAAFSPGAMFTELQIDTVKKKNQKHGAKPQRKKHHKNLAVLTAELQLEQRFYTFEDDFAIDLKKKKGLPLPANMGK